MGNTRTISLQYALKIAHEMPWTDKALCVMNVHKLWNQGRKFSRKYELEVALLEEYRNDIDSIIEIINNQHGQADPIRKAVPART